MLLLRRSMRESTHLFYHIYIYICVNVVTCEYDHFHTQNFDIFWAWKLLKIFVKSLSVNRQFHDFIKFFGIIILET